MRSGSLSLYIVLAVVLLAACRPDNQQDNAPAGNTPEISIISPRIVQSGDTLIVSGKYLQQAGLETSVFLAGRPAKIISQSGDLLKLLVPEKTQSGTLVIHVGKQTATGPVVTLIGTPVIINATPLYAYAGDTVTITGRDLTDDINTLHIWLDGKPATVVAVKTDTAQIIIPGGTNTKAVISWQTKNGPVYNTAPFKLSVRPLHLTGNDIIDYLSKDPGMDLMGAVLASFIKEDDYFHLRDTLKQYLTGDISCTIFLPNNEALNKMGIYKVTDAGLINDAFATVINSIHSGVLAESDLKEGQLYGTAYTQYIYAPGAGNPDLHAYLSFEKENGKTYVISTMNSTLEPPVYPNGTRRLILRRHQAGNCVIYETDGFMNWPYGLWN